MAGRFGVISSSLSLAAGQSVRRNAGDNGFEAYTPSAGGALETGVIVIWSGTIATIPTGFQLCDGTNGTPDLRDKFIVGARTDSGGVAKTCVTGAYTQSGGSNTHCHNICHAHYITISVSGYTGSCSSTSSVQSGSGASVNVTSHAHFFCCNASCNPSCSACSGACPTLPPYYALAYIERMS